LIDNNNINFGTKEQKKNNFFYKEILVIRCNYTQPVSY